MPFADDLKKQLDYFVDSYRKYFFKTYSLAMVFTVLFYLVNAMLLKYSMSDHGIELNNLVQLLWFNYSFRSYVLVDGGTAVSFLFIALFALLLMRLDENEEVNNDDITFSKLLNSLQPGDIILPCVFLLAFLLDFLLYKLYAASMSDEMRVTRYVYHLTTHLRQYIPLTFFALTIRWLANGRRLNLTFKDLLFTIATLWLFNALAYEFFALVRGMILDLLLLHFANSDLLILYQSLFSIPIIGVCFIGYYAAITGPVKIRSGPAAEPVVSDEPVDG